MSLTADKHIVEERLSDLTVNVAGESDAPEYCNEFVVKKRRPVEV